jgi:transposase
MSSETQPTARGRVRLRTADRAQVELVMRCPDELIPAGHPARAIWAVSGRLDLSAFHEPIRARAGVGGRDATDPRILFCLWLYATTRGVGSARRLARLCARHDAYRWICGGVTVNHHTLADFRVGFGPALDALFTRVLAALVDKGLVTARRVSQDGTRVRACAGSSSFRRGPRLDRLLADAQAHVAALRARLDDPAASAGLSARQRAARRRAARERAERVVAAVAQLPDLEARQARAAAHVGNGARGRKIRARQPRASTTDAGARVMKMPDGGFRPAWNVQLAVDTASRAVVGVAVSSEGSDGAGLAGPMREQVARRTGRPVAEHLVDGGYATVEEVEQAAAAGVVLFAPPKPPRNPALRGSEYAPRRADSAAVRAWRARMASPEGQAVYKERGSTVETVNADLKAHRGLGRLLVRGADKVLCCAVWSALAYNVMHFGPALLA